jgi:hypothetical protein
MPQVVVQHHDVAGLEGRRQKLLDPRLRGGRLRRERPDGHRAVEHERRHDAGLPQAGDQGRGAPVAVRHGRDQALALGVSAVAPRDGGGGTGLVEEDEPRRIHEALPGAPAQTLGRDVGLVLLGGSQGLFCAAGRSGGVRDGWLSVRPRHPAAVQLGLELGQRDVRRALDERAQLRWIGSEERPAIAAVARGRAAAGRAHPALSLMIAADGLTAKRRAAPRIELPLSTARTIRSRRSRDVDAGITQPRLPQLKLSNHKC